MERIVAFASLVVISLIWFRSQNSGCDLFLIVLNFDIRNQINYITNSNTFAKNRLNERASVVEL